MNNVFLDGKKFMCEEGDLPLLIHAEDHAGGSLFTITLAANLFSMGSKILFLTGYQMAEEEFYKQVGEINDDSVIFCFKDETKKFTELLKTLPDIRERVIIVKNIDLFDEEIFDLVLNTNKFIISGDVNKCKFKNKILNFGFNSKVLFSKLGNIEIPPLQKYEGFLVSKNGKGTIAVGVNT